MNLLERTRKAHRLGVSFLAAIVRPRRVVGQHVHQIDARGVAHGAAQRFTHGFGRRAMPAADIGEEKQKFDRLIGQ